MSPFPYFLLFTALTITLLVSSGDCGTPERKTKSTATNEVSSTQQKSAKIKVIKRDSVMRLGDPSAVQYSYRGRGYLSNRFGLVNPGQLIVRKIPKKLMKKLRKGSNRLRGSPRRKSYKKTGRTRVYFHNRFQNLKCRGRGYFGYRYPNGSFQHKCLLGGQYRYRVLPRYRYRYRYRNWYPTRARYPAYITDNSVSLLNPYRQYLSRFTLGAGDNVKKILVIM